MCVCAAHTFIVGNAIKVEIDFNWMLDVMRHWLRKFTGIEAECVLIIINNKIVRHLPLGIDLISVNDNLKKLIKSFQSENED